MDTIDHIPLQKIREDDTTGSSDEHANVPPHSPTHSHYTPHHVDATKRRRRSASVDYDFFDPTGAAGLERRLSRISTRTHENVRPTNDSDVTLSIPTDGSFDLEKAMRAVVKRREEANIKDRQLGVVFENLRVVGLGATASYQETLGSTLNPFNIPSKIRTARHPPLRDILSGFEGVVRPGEMILVLGRPGSGCSTFLKTLANQREEYHSVEGEVHYDSLSPEELSKHYRGDVQYCPEDDVHFPTLTVEQTLRFAAKTRAPQERVGHTRAEYVDMMVEVLTTIFGLRHAKGTMVGDAAIRGVSGGEKKRVSIAEAMATRSKLNSWDNSTRGLDASTALEFGRALRISTDIDNLSTIVSIYQAGETLYQLFDKVCVIYEGRMAYFGPADQAKQYFIDLGYLPANRQTTPDFLVAVTDPNGRIPNPDVPNRPRTAAEFAECFYKSYLGRQNREDIALYKEVYVGLPDRAHYYRESARAEHSRNTRQSSPYVISIPMQVRAVMQRRTQILWGNKQATIMNLVSFVLQGVIVGTVFVNAPESTSAFFSRSGVLFFALLFSALSSMAEIPALFNQRPIVARHQKAALYHPFIEAVALTLVDIPITFATTTVFGILIYFIVGLQRTAGQFFVFLLFLFTMAITMKAWFRAVASAFKAESEAQTLAGIMLLALVIYTGFTIPKPSMIGALKWISYINPLRYGFESVVANEFHTLNASCAAFVPQGPGYENVSINNQACSTVGSVAGQAYVDGNTFISLSYGYSYGNTWMNFGILIAFMAAFLAILFTYSEFNTTIAGESAMVLFKRGTKAPILDQDKKDEEATSVRSSRDTIQDGTAAAVEAEKALADHPPMTDLFSWQHLQYTVPVAEGQRRLLDDVSGYVAPGKLTALMGESGAGKTTLLNVLAQRVSTGVVLGDRFVNGLALPSDFQAQTGYCQQMDTHVNTDTVREALLVSANLRQPASVPLAEKEAYVEKCIKMCGLEAYADAVVGSLSIEHRKRTTIAVELAAKPKLLLFLDEPTSGLDSQSAWAIMAFLRSLADSGQAILCTIHQPSAELFQVFDRLLLLKKGGQTVYFGDLGHNSATLIQYFERNKSRVCHETENPAEFMLDIIGAGATAHATQDWHAIWKNSPECASLQTELDVLHAEGRKRGAVEATVHTEFATSWFHQFTVLVKRDFKFRWRDPTYLIAKFALNIMSGLFIGFTFFKAKDSQQATQNKLFSIFLGTILAAPLVNQLQVPFINMRNVYEIRERPSRMYHWSALLTSQLLAEIPWNILGSGVYFLCWFWTVGYPSSRAGYTFLVMGVIFPLYYTSLGQAVASMVPNAELAAILFSFLFSFVMTFNGVLQPFSQLGWWQWMYRVSPYTYLIEGLLGQALGRQNIICSSVELVSITPPSGQTCGEYLNPYMSANGGYLTNANATDSCSFCSTKTTDEFLGRNFNIFYAHRWRNVGFLCVFIAFNIWAIYVCTYFFRVRTGSLLDSFKKRIARRR